MTAKSRWEVKVREEAKTFEVIYAGLLHAIATPPTGVMVKLTVPDMKEIAWAMEWALNAVEVRNGR